MRYFNSIFALIVNCSSNQQNIDLAIHKLSNRWPSVQDFSDLKRQVQQMQEEAEKLEEIQKEVEAQMGTSPSPANSQSIDARSVYVGNVQSPTPTHHSYLPAFAFSSLLLKPAARAHTPWACVGVGGNGGGGGVCGRDDDDDGGCDGGGG
jgi:hypothetical protein